MNATDFIKQHGVEKAREVLLSAYTHCIYVETPTHFDVNENVLVHEIDFKEMHESYVDLKKLKRLVESVDLVKKHGGLFATKCQLDKGGTDFEWYGENGEFGLTDLDDLKQAIADYESIYSNTPKKGELETLRDCDTSPNCKEFDERVK